MHSVKKSKFSDLFPGRYFGVEKKIQLTSLAPRGLTIMLLYYNIIMKGRRLNCRYLMPPLTFFSPNNSSAVAAAVVVYIRVTHYSIQPSAYILKLNLIYSRFFFFIILLHNTIFLRLVDWKKPTFSLYV